MWLTTAATCPADVESYSNRAVSRRRGRNNSCSASGEVSSDFRKPPTLRRGKQIVLKKRTSYHSSMMDNRKGAWRVHGLPYVEAFPT